MSFLSPLWAREKERDEERGVTPCKTIQQRIGHTVSNQPVRLIEGNRSILCFDSNAVGTGASTVYETGEGFVRVSYKNDDEKDGLQTIGSLGKNLSFEESIAARQIAGVNA